MNAKNFNTFSRVISNNVLVLYHGDLDDNFILLHENDVLLVEVTS